MNVIDNIAKKIDKLLCMYFGLENEVLRAHQLRLSRKKFDVVCSIPFKRHCIKQPLTQFVKNELNKIPELEKEKFSHAVGKIMAANLIVSFEEPTVKENRNDSNLH